MSLAFCNVFGCWLCLIQISVLLNLFILILIIMIMIVFGNYFVLQFVCVFKHIIWFRFRFVWYCGGFEATYIACPFLVGV